MSRIWFFDDPDDKRYFFKQFLAGVFTTVAMTGLDQDMMQKNLSCRNLRESQRNMVTYGFGFIPVNLVFLTLGILLYKYAGELGMFSGTMDSLHEVGGAPLTGDQLFPYLATGIHPDTGLPFLPLGVSVLFVLGLVAAAFSSAGSAVTSLTTSVMVDFLNVKGEKVKKTRFYTHIVNSVLIGVMIYVFHLMASGSVINAVYVLASYTYGPLLGLFFFGLLTKRKPRDRYIPLVCVASPVICFFLDRYSEVLFNGYHMGYELLIINGLITALGLYLISIMRKFV